MTIIERDVRVAAIEASVQEARHPGHDPARWALPLIAEADRLAGGRWSLVTFDVAEAGALWLAPHAGEPCHGDTAWLGGAALQPGQCLADAATWLKAEHQTYAASNSSCWSRIVTARDARWGPIVVAPFPVGDRTAPVGTPLVVIDGLHRALGWALRASPSTLHAYLAGPAIDAAAGHWSDGR